MGYRARVSTHQKGKVMHRARIVFSEWQELLEADDDLYGGRLLVPRAGLIWRNAAAREFYAAHGFLPSPTTPWPGVKAWMSPKELLAMDWVVRRAFVTGRSVVHESEAQADGHEPVRTLVTFRAVFGHYACGVLVTLLQPCGV